MTSPEALFLEHRGRVQGYLTRAVGHPETARDLLQDVFVRVTRASARPEGEAEQRAWIFSIARNLTIDHHRRERLKREEMAAPVVDRRPASQDTTAIVRQALAALDDLDRDIFLMREVGGLGYDEIATACAITPDAVRSRIHRTRLRLRDWLSAPIQARRQHPLRQTEKTR